MEVFDTNNDGVVSKEEWERGKKIARVRYSDALEIDVEKLTNRYHPSLSVRVGDSTVAHVSCFGCADAG